MAISKSFPHPVISMSFLTFAFMCINSQYPGPYPPPPLVIQVCRSTTNFDFCMRTLYSDPRTPYADKYGLAYIAYGLADTYVKYTLYNYIDTSLREGRGLNENFVQGLQNCHRNYVVAVSATSEAFRELDRNLDPDRHGPAGFYLLALAIANSAQDCEEGFRGYSPMSDKNGYAIRLAEICYVVSKLLVVIPSEF